MGHFRVAFCLCVKTRLNPIHMKVSSAYRFILVELQVLHETRFETEAQGNSGMAHCGETRYLFSDFTSLTW